MRDAIDGPVVSMWCVTLCLTGLLAAQACVTAGNSDRRERKGLLVSWVGQVIPEGGGGHGRDC